MLPNSKRSALICTPNRVWEFFMLHVVPGSLIFMFCSLAILMGIKGWYNFNLHFPDELRSCDFFQIFIYHLCIFTKEVFVGHLFSPTSAFSAFSLRASCLSDKGLIYAGNTKQFGLPILFCLSGVQQRVQNSGENKTFVYLCCGWGGDGEQRKEKDRKG